MRKAALYIAAAGLALYGAGLALMPVVVSQPPVEPGQVLATHEREDGTVRYSYIGGPLNDAVIPAAEEAARRSGAEIAREVVEERTPSARVYEATDGTRVAAFVSKPQQYKDLAGNWWQVEFASAPSLAAAEKLPRVGESAAVRALASAGLIAYAATGTFYPDPSAESTSVDGYVQAAGKASFAAAHDAADGTDFNDSGTLGQVVTGKTGTGSDWEVDRFFILFDTSTLPDNATISATTISIVSVSVTNQCDSGTDYVSIVTSSPASNTTLALADFDQMGTTEQHDAGERKDLTGMSGTQTFTLNATGRGNVSKTGVSKFGVRTGPDILNSTACGNNQMNYWQTRTADNADVTSDPTMVVTYTVPATFTPLFFSAF